MAWQDQVAGGFGSVDCIFAGHPSDEERAKDAVKAAKAAGASKDDFCKEAIWHVYKNVAYHPAREDLFQKVETGINRMW